MSRIESTVEVSYMRSSVNKAFDKILGILSLFDYRWDILEKVRCKYPDLGVALEDLYNEGYNRGAAVLSATEETVEVSKEEHDRLVEDQKFLRAIQARLHNEGRACRRGALEWK